MNQLEALANYQKQIVWNKLVNDNTIFLGNIYISFEYNLCRLYNDTSLFLFDIGIPKPYTDVIDQAYILSYIHGNFLIEDNVTLIGCNDIILLNDFKDQQDIFLYNEIQEMFLFMQSEYSEFIEYIRIHFDKIIANGGRVK